MTSRRVHVTTWTCAPREGNQCAMVAPCFQALIVGVCMNRQRPRRLEHGGTLPGERRKIPQQNRYRFVTEAVMVAERFRLQCRCGAQVVADPHHQTTSVKGDTRVFLSPHGPIRLTAANLHEIGGDDERPHDDRVTPLILESAFSTASCTRRSRARPRDPRVICPKHFRPARLYWLTELANRASTLHLNGG